MTDSLNRMAAALSAQPSEVILTSGASEANNTAMKGILRASRHVGRHVITSALEHASVSGCLTAMQEQGADIDVVSVGRDGRVDVEELAGLLRRNLVLILGMAFMTLFAITNVVCFDDVELLNIPLPEGLVKLCGIFRASGRMFYPVYYVLMTACIVGLARLLRRVGKAALYPAVLVLVAAVQLFDLSAMIAEKHTAMAETAAKPQPYPQELVDCRDNYGTLMLADDIIHARNVICAAWHPGMVTNGYDVNTYTGAWNVTIDWTAQTSAAVDSGTLDPDTLYVTGDADRFASWQAQYGDKADYITWDIAATGIYDRRDEYYFMAPKQ